MHIAYKKVKYFIFCCFLITITSHIFSQNLSQNKTSTIRLQLWALLDPVPSWNQKPQEGTNTYSFAITQLQSLAPFVIEGMVYGWNFSYTPSDILRNVDEYFEMTSTNLLGNLANNIIYKEPLINEGVLNCWIEFTRNQGMMKEREYWTSITFPKIKGTGHGKVSNGIDGIKDAYNEALKNAVKKYAQGIIKNKPKEINGRVLLTDTPRMYITNGEYTVDLDFFLDVGTIIPYIQF